MIRIATEADAAACHAIYAPIIASSAITFETDLPGEHVMLERIRTRLATHPWLVWDDHGDVLAYAYAGRFRERAAYDWMAETSIYVHENARRRGIARRLYGALLDAMRLQGINQAVGVITLPGESSVAMHGAMGFTPAGIWPKAGYKLGQWWDVGVWVLFLSEPETPPKPVVPFAGLADSAELAALLAKA
ncbi:GNAT family N-acetyltransferase [Luteibacter rhizovicinus DSM 16549]|uniref:GNAT family N-acetyltransferase n=1 Tax=Luteibacter rhizovicinus DSM 16549 TaxID=1440763 RepID=A0A0G9HCJ5_9GAMM|nr:GNAT family N-acetyltransferase [Luteibacter rhizovicinus]APG02549.1 GNAT family N-acetyltransferase [Luteibacter rhizovicinus DSM 16549]KLD67348.1 acetyltransferase [Luteibacter rhizovicinus DSM 16549]KLD77679.1 acetyltransferase [Xanthomonas hyacinthi DSM 19077]